MHNLKSSLISICVTFALFAGGCEKREPGVEVSPVFQAEEAINADTIASPTIFIASDSTASNHKARRWPMAGWGVFLQCAVPPSIAVENHAMGGRSTKTFLEEGRLDRIAETISDGDYLLIQFGHNDAYEKKPERFVTPEVFAENLLIYIDTARNAGASPVLLTPVIRRNFKAGVAVEDFPAYAQAMRDVATAEDVKLIELGALTGEWITNVGEEDAKAMFMHYTPEDKMYAYPEGIEDDTHFSELGARRVAGIVATALKNADLPISDQIKLDVSAFTRDEMLGSLSCQ